MKKVPPKILRSDSAEGIKRGPQRTCVACRKSLDQDHLVRYVLSPQGEIVVDYRRKLPGRGVYTCHDRACIENAVKRGQLARALRHQATCTADDLWQDLQAQVIGRVWSLLGMARKAGQVISGTSLVLQAIRGKEEYAFLVRATDLSEASVERIESAARRHGLPCFALFDKAQLGRLLGKSERGVVAVKKAALAIAIRSELERLINFAGEFNG